MTVFQYIDCSAGQAPFQELHSQRFKRDRTHEDKWIGGGKNLGEVGGGE